MALLLRPRIRKIYSNEILYIIYFKFFKKISLFNLELQNRDNEITLCYVLMILMIKCHYYYVQQLILILIKVSQISGVPINHLSEIALRRIYRVIYR